MNSAQPPPNAADPSSEPKAESLEHPTREMMKPAVVLRPTPTLPSGAAFGLRPQGSAFQPPPLRPTASRSPGIAPMIFPTSMGLLPHLPHPARARPSTSPAQPGPNDSLITLQTMSEDELAATTVGSLSGRREDVVGPTSVPGNQLARQSVKDGTAGEDSMPRMGGHAQQQALMQQQMMAAYSWQMYVQAAMQNGTAPMPMAAMNGMNVPFMPPMSFMHPEAMAAAYGYPPFDWRRRPREWDSGSRRRRRNENKVCSNCQTTSTPFWRKDRHDGSPLCNACGLYYAKNEAHRPQALWKQDADEQAQPAVAGATSSGTPAGTPPILPPNLPAGMPSNAATSASMAPLSTSASVPRIAPQSTPMNATSSVPISMPVTAPVSAQPKLPVSLPVNGQPSVPSGMPIKMLGSMPMGMPNDMPVSTQPRAALSAQPRPLLSGPFSASAGMQPRMQASAPISIQLQLPATAPAGQQFRIPVGAPIGLQPTLPTTTPVNMQYRPFVSAPFSPQPRLPIGAPISMQPRLPVSAPVGVQFRLPGSAAVGVQPQLPGSAPISLQSRPLVSVHVGVQLQMPLGAPVGLQFRQPVSAPAGVQQQMSVSAPLPLQHRLPVIAQVGVHLQPPVSAPGSVQTRLPTSAPINAQCQLLVSAPVSMQSQMPVSAPVKAESTYGGHSRILVNTSGGAQTQALADGPISAAVSTQPHLPPYLLPDDTPSKAVV